MSLMCGVSASMRGLCFFLKAFPRALILAMCAVVVVVGGCGIGGVGRHLRALVKDDQCPDYPGNPSGAGENRHNQERSTSLVHYSQRRENNR